MISRKSCIALVMLTSTIVYSQQASNNDNKEKLPLLISSYNINAVNPGIKIGIEYPLKELIKYKVKRNSKSKTVSKLWLLNGSSALGIEPFSNTNWLTSIEIARKITKNSKWFSSPSLGLGSLVRFNNGESWEAVDGEVSNVGKTSRTYFTPTLGMAFGRNVNI